MKIGSLIFLTLASILLANTVSDADTQVIDGDRGQAVDDSSSTRSLTFFDWHAYMRFYDKQYSSLTQQLVRQKLFVARVLQVFITQAKYRMYTLNYYTAINKWSDLTPNESKHLMEGDQSDSSEGEMTDDKSANEILLSILSDQSESAYGFVEELQKERSRSLSINRSRRKRSAEERNRELSVANLVKGSENTPAKLDPNLKIRWIVSPDNPDYEPNTNPTESIEDLQENVEDIPPNEIKELSKESQLTFTPATAFSLMRSTFSGAINWFSADDSSEEEDIIEDKDADKTVVLRDWRQSGCIGPARDQGYCASCYAVSSMAFVEWALCSSRDHEFTPLSVQYMVSCGKQMNAETQGEIKLEGCTHGVSKQTQDFVREYGVELEINMPYVARDTQCPIEINSPRKRKGYIRPNVKPPMRLSAGTSQLDLALKIGPVIVSMREPVDFLGYGGGMVENCQPYGGHAMLIVGNMIHDGEEYLLIKNSFGPYWGYQGFFKFRRSSVKECVKEFIVPMISFPGRKSQERRIKAYMANKQNKSLISHIDDDETISSLASLVSGQQ